ncbi:MAG TPA: DUF192 domain-containing protein [Steroidobacteraceae bacterium]|nr:DUF192 domain-containing protein [Steroidobacteraceae bacterium]
MNTRRTHPLALFCLGLAFAACRAGGTTPDSLADFPKTTVTLSNEAGTHLIDAWLADSPAHRSQGLMFVRTLPPDSGMLFVYGESQYISMWMKNTYVSLDMLFVGDDGRIGNIVENAKPLSLDTIDSGGKAIAVLELPAGTAKRLGLRTGDRVHSPAIRL